MFNPTKKPSAGSVILAYGPECLLHHYDDLANLSKDIGLFVIDMMEARSWTEGHSDVQHKYFACFSTALALFTILDCIEPGPAKPATLAMVIELMLSTLDNSTREQAYQLIAEAQRAAKAGAGATL